MSKLNGFHKFLSLLLIAVLVVSVVGFAVSGGGSTDKSDSGNVGGVNDETDENKDGDGQAGENPPNNDSQTPSDDGENTLTPPQNSDIYTSLATGLQVTKDEYSEIPTGVLVDPKSSLYGVSYADISIEFPIEDGTSRLLVYSTSGEVMWKIGALMPTRRYISCMSGFFGGVVVSYGCDDVVIYDAWEIDEVSLDISQYKDCYYIENTVYIYTNERLIDTAKNRLPTTTVLNGYGAMPFVFSEDVSDGVRTAKSVSIPYSSSNVTKLTYNDATGEYAYLKNDVSKMDMHTGEYIAYKNVFILFTNATTYENVDGTELVIDTVSGGKGIYISGGKMTEFTWSVKDGELIFSNLWGERLSVNRGTSYIAYYKASISDNVSIS